MPLKILIILLFFFSLATKAQINHVEPLNWWVGMKNPAVQLLVNGNAVGETTPSISYPGVTIKSVSQAQSKNYLFIDLVVAGDAKPGTFPIHFTKAGKSIYKYNYTLLPRQRDASEIVGFNSSDVIYLIVPDRFANGDYTNDVVAGMKESKINREFDGGRHGGDLRGIINQLDYIAQMGFTAIWTTPVLENDMPGYSYHGYSITNHYKVDPRYGTLDEYKELSAKARQKGIKLIYDEVVNHIGLNYWWMNDLPFANWINKTGTYVTTNHRRTINQDKYAAEFDKDLMTRGWFDKTMPDMNAENPFMANYLIQNSIWWVETLQLGGIRQDTYCYSDKNFLKNWSCSIMNEYPNFNIVGEEWSLNPLITSYWQQGKQNSDGYLSCLKSVMDFPLQEALTQSLLGTEWNTGFNRLYEALANDFVYADPKNILVMGDNHDMDRLLMQLKQDVQLTKMALTYLLTIRGIPQIFYGTEVLMDNTPNHKVDGLIRADFPGGWKDDNSNGFVGTNLSTDQQAMQAYLKKLLNWRKNNSVIAEGETMHFAPFNEVYVYFRYNQDKTIMIVMNKNNSITNIDPNRFSEIIKTKTTAQNVLTMESFDLKKPLPIASKSAVIFELK